MAEHTLKRLTRQRLAVRHLTKRIARSLGPYYRMFPAFINETAVDWFFTWPQDALEEVATAFLSSAELDSGAREALARACSHAHMHACKEAEAFRQEAQRTIFVTPTKFLRLVDGYRGMLMSKRRGVHEKIRKLSSGLSKLVEARQQVEAMNEELEAKKEDVAKKQRECDELMVVIAEKRMLADDQMRQAKIELNDPSFLTRVKNFDKDSITNATLKKIEKYTKDPSFAPPNVQKVSRAAGALCLWVHAMQMYAEVYREVEPKRLKLRFAEEQLEKKQNDLRLARSRLDGIQSRLQELNNQYAESLDKKSELNNSAEELRVKLERAESLITGLADERDRWELSLESNRAKLSNITGDALLGAAFMSYAGPFTSSYRARLVKDLWINSLQESKIPCSLDFDFTDFFVTPLEVRQWQLDGLPTDHFSAENGVLITEASKWPLVIDPQNRANRWIRKLKAADNITIIDPESKALLRILHLAVQTGRSVLLERLLTQIDPSLEALITKKIVLVDGSSFVRIGDQLISYDKNFSLWMTTKVGNPQFLPEIEAHVTLINFVIMQDGLTEQLLGIVVMKEEPSLEAHKHALVMRLADGRKRLQDIEDQILRLLTDARGCLLDDMELIGVLQVWTSAGSSYYGGRYIGRAYKAFEVFSEVPYNCRPCGHRASVLYFVLQDLILADSMYQFSLDAYEDLFMNSVSHAKESNAVAASAEEHVLALNADHTLAVYSATACGGHREWRRWFGSQEPERAALPGDWQTRLEALQRLVVIRCLRPDRVIPAASRFVAEAMDAKFVESAPMDWGEILASSKNSVPLLFILSGVDPIGQLVAFANSKNTNQRSEEELQRVAGGDERYRRLFFSLCWLHSLLLERGKFHNVGWSSHASFSDIDFLVGDSLLATYCEQSGLRQHVRDLPSTDPPEVFGQHVNAEIQLQITETDDLLAALSRIQPPVDGPAGIGNNESRESRILKCCDHLDRILSQRLDVALLQEHNAGKPSPLRIVMLQEAQRLHTLVTCVRDMVQQLRRAISGLLLMSEELEALQLSLLNGKVPQCWHFAFPSLKPLVSWAVDLAQRLDQINRWGLVSVNQVELRLELQPTLLRCCSAAMYLRPSVLIPSCASSATSATVHIRRARHAGWESGSGPSAKSLLARRADLPQCFFDSAAAAIRKAERSTN
ncbi:hypothetical protein ACSSS7_003651 [Eimeria intestinalis]